MWLYARRALQQLEDAIKAEPTNPRLPARIREMRANLARLELYFNHKAPAARDIFVGILDELNKQDERDVAPALVATLRNLAECLFEFDPLRARQESRAEARRHLTRAGEIAHRFELGSLGAEALYSPAKLDETEGEWPAARDHLEQTIGRARSVGHVVCQRIAEMRVFWLGVCHQSVAFDYSLFAARLRKLEFLESHAWARRYAAQSRLWAAHVFDRAGDLAGMKDLLRRNIAAFEPIEVMSSSADRRFVALAFAGLANTEAAGGANAANVESWTKFKALAWAPEWIEQHGATDPSRYWQGDA